MAPEPRAKPWAQGCLLPCHRPPPRDQVVESLTDLDVSRIWTEATDDERRVLIEELVHGVSIFPDHLEVTIFGALPRNLTLEEFGLKQSPIGGVGGPFDPAGSPAQGSLRDEGAQTPILLPGDGRFRSRSKSVAFSSRSICGGDAH
jgi:hypothetical protein